jgi:ATP-dependent RNA helicase DDX41
MRDNRSTYLIKTKETIPVPQILNDNEIFNIMRSSALLSGLESTKSERKIKPIAGWTFPQKYKKLNTTQINEIKEKYQIKTDGEDILPPISTFNDMHFPEAVLKGLGKMGIVYPSPIQMQGIPMMY